MPSKLSDKKSKIVVVDPSGAVRQMMTETVRGLGFENVEGKSSIQDVLQHLEADTADWIIAPLMSDQPVNALHLLKIIAEHGDLKSVRLSLFLDDSEKFVLAPAFAQGLLSCHHKPFTKDTLTEELKSLMASLTANSFSEPMTAADYLRQHLKSEKNYSAWADLEKSLLEMYPGNPQILLHLAEPQFNLGKKDLALTTLAQVKLLDTKLADKAMTLAKELFGEEKTLDATAGSSAAGGTNVLGAKSVVIIDSDDAIGQGVEDILKGLGVPNISRFSSGDEAWTKLSSSPEPDLIVLEWRIPKLSGPLLIQRLRHHGFLTVPIVVLSSLLKPDDMPAVREIGIAYIIPKPLKRDVFIPGLIWTMQQERLPTDKQAVERKIRHFLKAGKAEEAQALRAQFLADADVPMGRKRLIEAEFAYAAANYELAKDAAIEALKLTGDNINVLNVLGKAFMRMTNFDAALKCFKKAQELSPNNIERLCLIAESQTELGDNVAAQDSLADAGNLDPDAKAVVEAGAKVAITSGDTEAAKRIMSEMESLDGLVSYMNNKAVAFAKCGQSSDAVELYKKTLASIPDAQTAIKATVNYNLALSQVREGEIDAAILLLTDVLASKEAKVGKKAHALMERLKVAREKGLDFRLNSAAPEVAAKAAPGQPPPSPVDQESQLSSAEDHRKLLAMVEAKRGDLCCYLVFNCTESDLAKIAALQAKPPRFNRRDAIARSEGLGAERAAKAS